MSDSSLKLSCPKPQKSTSVVLLTTVLCTSKSAIRINEGRMRTTYQADEWLRLLAEHCLTMAVRLPVVEDRQGGGLVPFHGTVETRTTRIGIVALLLRQGRKEVMVCGANPLRVL